MIVTSPNIPAKMPTDDQIEKKFQEYISAMASYCKRETYHGEYTGRTTFEDKPNPADDENSTVRMTIFIDSTYLWYRIRIYPKVLDLYKNGEYKEIARDMLHEHCHLFMDPVEKLFMWDASASQKEHYVSTIERQTQRICNSIFDLLPDGWYLPEKLMGDQKP